MTWQTWVIRGGIIYIAVVAAAIAIFKTGMLAGSTTNVKVAAKVGAEQCTSLKFDVPIQDQPDARFIVYDCLMRRQPRHRCYVKEPEGVQDETGKMRRLFSLIESPSVPVCAKPTA